ncbi:MAG: tetratricopeptide repeat protein [Sphingobacteriaceae bacterium]|nr:tetratricopeptide repeat protein [Sphingobacteriaceae bacterium]
MRTSFIYIILLFLAGDFLFAQKDAKLIYEGNDYYVSGKTLESTEIYRNALKENPHNAKAHFNLGNSLYKNAFMIKGSKENFIQGGKKVTPDSLANLVFGEAAQSFAQVANSVSDKDTLHRTWHNIGNCYLQQKDFKSAVDAYKKSLKFNSKDEETRYNLAYALKHMPKDQGGGGGQSKQNQKEDKNDKNKNSSPKNEMSKDQAEQLLKALMREEKKLQDKRKQKQEDAGNTTVEKDW